MVSGWKWRNTNWRKNINKVEIHPWSGIDSYMVLNEQLVNTL